MFVKLYLLIFVSDNSELFCSPRIIIIRANQTAFLLGIRVIYICKKITPLRREFIELGTLGQVLTLTYPLFIYE